VVILNASSCLLLVPNAVYVDHVFPFLLPSELRSFLSCSKTISASLEIPLGDLSFVKFCCKDHDAFTRGFVLDSQEPAAGPTFSGADVVNCEHCGLQICCSGMVADESSGGVSIHSHDCSKCGNSLCRACIIGDTHRDSCGTGCAVHSFAAEAVVCDDCSERRCLACAVRCRTCSICGTTACEDCGSFEYIMECESCNELQCEDCEAGVAEGGAPLRSCNECGKWVHALSECDEGWAACELCHASTCGACEVGAWCRVCGP